MGVKLMMISWVGWKWVPDGDRVYVLDIVFILCFSLYLSFFLLGFGERVKLYLR